MHIFPYQIKFELIAEPFQSLVISVKFGADQKIGKLLAGKRGGSARVLSGPSQLSHCRAPPHHILSAGSFQFRVFTLWTKDL